MATPSIEEQLEALRAEIQERAMRLSDLDVIIQDYREERQQLLQEIVHLKQQYWDLLGEGDGAKA